jgi:hypothetical protein
MQQFQRFCPSCGKGVSAIPPMPAEGRIAGHLRLLGILWLAISAFRLLPGLLLVSIFHSGFPIFPGVPGFVHGIVQSVGGLLLAGAVIGIVAGWGLLERQPWARMLAIVLACLSLLDMPFGTALGIYTLVVLLPAGSEEEYRRMARATM